MRWTHFLQHVWQALKMFATVLIVLVIITAVLANGVRDLITKSLDEQLKMLEGQNQRSIEDRAEIKNRLEAIEKAVGK